MDEAADREPAIREAVVYCPLGNSDRRTAGDTVAPAAIVLALALWIRIMRAGVRVVRPDGIYHRVVPLAMEDVYPRLPVRLRRLARCDWLVRDRASLSGKRSSAARLADSRGPAGRRAADLDPHRGCVHEHSPGLEHRCSHWTIYRQHLRSACLSRRRAQPASARPSRRHLCARALWRARGPTLHQPAIRPVLLPAGWLPLRRSSSDSGHPPLMLAVHHPYFHLRDARRSRRLRRLHGGPSGLVRNGWAGR